MKTIIFISCFSLMSCDGLFVSSKKYDLSYGESININRSGKNYTVRFIDVNDKRCQINPAFSIIKFLPGQVSLEITKKDCEGIECSQKISLQNYDCQTINDNKDIKGIFTKESKDIYGVSKEIFGFDIGITKLEPYAKIEQSPFLKYNYEDKNKYKISFIIQ
jgi:hypothetical protein